VNEWTAQLVKRAERLCEFGVHIRNEDSDPVGSRIEWGPA